MAKLKFMEVTIVRLKAFKSGISGNATAWAGQEDTPTTVQAHIDALEAADADIASLETLLTQKRQAAKVLAKQKEAVADAIELRVKGIHATATSKWPEYGVDDPNAAAAAAKGTRPVPEKGDIKNIMDDYDGIGFIVELEGLKEADSYEVQRGAGANAADVNTIPAFSYLRNVRKLSFVDDDVEKGIRYFYRLRGINSQGLGEWSEPVSRVQ
jgi:hypothetical protein